MGAAIGAPESSCPEIFMSLNPAIRKLNHDLSRIRHDQAGARHAAAAAKSLEAAEVKALAQLHTDEAAAVDAFVEAPPTDPAAIGAAFRQMFQFGRQEVQTR